MGLERTQEGIVMRSLAYTHLVIVGRVPAIPGLSSLFQFLASWAIGMLGWTAKGHFAGIVMRGHVYSDLAA